jgi:transcriptional regulator with XRE-family HTH domain
MTPTFCQDRVEPLKPTGRSIRAIEGLGGRLNAVMFRLGMSQTELAQKSGVSRDRVWRAVNHSEGTVRTIRALATALGVTADSLMHGEPSEIEPAGRVSEESPSYAGQQLEDFLSNFDSIVRTLRNFPGGPLGMRLRIGFLNAIEDAARETGNKLPIEYYELRKKVSDGEL